jgi:hypothetical protein
VDVGAAVFVTCAFVADGVTFVGVTVKVNVSVGVADTVPVPAGVAVDVAVFVGELVSVGDGVGVSVGSGVLVAVAESASACAVCATMVGSWFTSKVGMAVCAAMGVIQASVKNKINKLKNKFRFIERLPVAKLA